MDGTGQKRMGRTACSAMAVGCLLVMGALAARASETSTSVSAPSGALEVRAWWPDGVPRLRGLVVYVHGLAGDALDYAGSQLWQALAEHHGFALVGTHFTSGDPNAGGSSADLDALDRAITAIAQRSGHGELGSAPIAIAGFSAGSGFAARYARHAPARTIAFFHNKGQRIDLVASVPTAAAAAVPGMLTYGEYDTTRIQTIRDVFATNRGAGALWSLIVDWGVGHEPGGADAVGAAYLDRIIPLRIPVDWTPGSAPALVALREGDGWLGDQATVEYAVPVIVARAAFAGTEAQARQRSWLPDRFLAHLWRAKSARWPAARVAATTSWGTTAGSWIDLTISDRITSARWFAGDRELGLTTTWPYDWWSTSVWGVQPYLATVQTASGAAISDMRIVATRRPLRDAPTYVNPGAPATATTGSTVTITPSVSDADGILSVALAVDGAIVATATAAPWSTSWTARSGSHRIAALVTDRLGVMTVSATSWITVGGGSSPWPGLDIGAVAAAGSDSKIDGTWTVRASGADIWGTSDGFRLVALRASGDISMTARVVSLSASDPWTKAGLMIRDSEAPDARHASVFVTGANGTVFQHRDRSGDWSYSTSGPWAAAPCWLRLERVGNVITSWMSSDGSTWRMIDERWLTLNATVLVGFAVTSHRDGTIATAQFTNVQLVAGPSAAQ